MKNERDAGRMLEFSDMMKTPAWKELERWAGEDQERSMRSIDSIPAKELTVGQIAEERGYRNGIRRLLGHAAYMRDTGGTP